MIDRKVRSKYGAVKTQVDGITFASIAEASRYKELKFLERVGQIDSLELQPAYELAPSVKYTGASRAKPALRYVADFRYRDHHGKLIVEDVKGRPTEAYLIKKHLMLSIHGIEILETGRAKRSSRSA